MKVSFNSFVLLGTGVLLLALGFFVGRISSRPQAENEKIYARYDQDQIVKGKDVLPDIQKKLDQLNQQIVFVKKAAVEKYILKQKGMTVDSPTADVDFRPLDLPGDLQNKKNRNLKGLSKVELKKRMAANSQNLQKAFQQRDVKYQKLLADANIVWQISDLDLKEAKIKSSSFASKGPSRAAVTLVLVSNFHCAFCLSVEDKIAQLQKKYPDKIQLQFRFLIPENSQPIVTNSVYAAYCAEEQEKFSSLRELMMKTPPESDAEIGNLATQAGLNMEKFESCLKDDSIHKRLHSENADLLSAGILQAPTILINNKVLNGTTSFETLDQLIRQEL